ncbi:MAG: hypothetical protein QM496_13935 [Verrucomicrobiota bacterium]
MADDLGTPVVPRVLGEGSTPVIWKGKENPLTDFMTRCAFAALTSGCDLISDKGFQHTVADDAETVADLDASRSVTWIWDNNKTAHFGPVAEETISIQEFERRFMSDTWYLENPEHPISYMRAFLEKSRDGFGKIASIKPSRRVCRDDAVATVPHDASDAEIDAVFEQLNDK